MVLNRIRSAVGICRGKAGNIDDAMDEAGLPLLGVVPEDEDLISCGNSGKAFLRSSTPARRALSKTSRGGWTENAFH